MDSSKSKFLQAAEEEVTVTRRITGCWHFETSVDLIIKQWKLHKVKTDGNAEKYIKLAQPIPSM